MSVEIHYTMMALHLSVGFVLVFLSIRAFKKTRYPPMALLALGFSLIVIGDTIIGDIVEFLNTGIFGEIIEEGTESVGFVILILAVKRS
jgi:uncharacterized membrane protein (UPF0182 family)